jgi:hypothetical protein
MNLNTLTLEFNLKLGHITIIALDDDIYNDDDIKERGYF